MGSRLIFLGIGLGLAGGMVIVSVIPTSAMVGCLAITSVVSIIYGIAGFPSRTW